MANICILRNQISRVRRCWLPLRQLVIIYGLFDSISRRWYNIPTMTDDLKKTLKSHGEQLELIATTVLGHSEKLKKLDRIEAKIDDLPTAKKLDDTIAKIDKLLKKASDIEQEGTMRTHAMRRLEDKVDKNTHDIQQMKPALGLS